MKVESALNVAAVARIADRSLARTQQAINEQIGEFLDRQATRAEEIRNVYAAEWIGRILNTKV